jgi:uncharacterized membrane protein YhiD involved in acid resistance
MVEFPSLLDLQERAAASGPMAVNLAAAFICGLALSWLYRRTYRGTAYSMTFDRSLVTLTIITAIVIAVIGNNLARAFGLVGAMSIVRFRTAVKDAQDLVFIFFSLAVGLASGVGLRGLAMGGTLSVGAIIYVMARVNYGALDQRELVVQMQYATKKGEEPASVYAPVLARFCRDFNLLGARSADDEGTLDLTLFVRLQVPGTAAGLTAQLAALPQVDRVNVFYDEEPL